MTAAAPSRPGTRGLRILAAVLLALLTLLGPTQPAAAHAELVSTTPSDGAALAEAPATLELRFNEPVGLIDGAIRLLAADADPTPLRATVTDATVIVELPELAADASHAVAYRVASADGHPVSGVVSFTVGDAAPGAAPSAASGTPAATELLVRVLSGLLYLGLLAFAGLVFATRLVLRGAGASSRSLLVAERWSLAVAGGAAVLLVPASGLRVVGAALAAVFDPGAWAPGVSWPVVAVAILVVVLGWSAHLLGGPRTGAPTRRGVLAVGLAGAAAVSPALVGHTLAYNPPVMLVADAGHLLAGSFWFGGLLAMLLFLHSRPGRDEARAALVRFSRAALGAVALLAVTGTGMAVLVLGSFENLVGTTYGRLLLVKVMVVAAVVLLATWVRFRLLPTSRSLLRFFRALRYEAALLVAVALLTGFLANTSPSHGHLHGAQQVSVQSQGLAVEGSLAPSAVGTNTLSFTLLFDGAAVESGDVAVSFRLPEQDLGPVAAVVEPRPDGSWAATVDLPAAGEWEAQVAARVSRFERPIAVFQVTVG